MGSGPSEFLFGFAELHRAGKPVAMFEETELGFGKTWPRLLEASSARIAGAIGVSPRLVFRLGEAIKGPLKPYSVLVATTQSIGMALAALGAMGRHNKRIVIMTMGLLEPEASDRKRRIFRKLLSGVDLAVLSKPEASSIRGWVENQDRVHNFTFGVDLSYWSPGNSSAGDDVLSIGNDPARDFATLLAAWRPEYPRLTIITSRSVETDKPNVIVERGNWRSLDISDDEIRERFRKARLVITPVIDTIQPSGQSATLQAMACGRPVIMSANRGLWDPGFMTKGVCRLVPPGDPVALSLAIRNMLDDRIGAEAVGRAAHRAMAEQDISALAMAQQIEQLLS